MPFQTVFRIIPAVWIAPVLLVLAIIYAGAAPTRSEPYPPALTAAGAFTLFIIAPVCAACAAWEGGRLRRPGWFTQPHVRSTITVALSSLMPVLVVGLLAISAAVTFKLLEAGATIPDVRILVVAFAVVVAHILLGFALGLKLPSVVAVPAILVLDYAWMVLPPALEPLWLRHLTGDLSSCCSVSTDLAPRASGAALVVACGLAGTALVLMSRHLNAIRVALAFVPVLLGMGVGVMLVRGMGPDAVVPRDASILVCSSGQPQVCVWPEHRARLMEVSEIVTGAANAWRQVGIPVPTQFRDRSSLSPGERTFGFSLEADRHVILNSLAYSLLPPFPKCAIEGTEPWLGGDAENYVLAWLDATAGMSGSELANRFEPNVIRTVAKVRALPSDQERAWFERNVAALRRCDLPPQLQPIT